MSKKKLTNRTELIGAIYHPDTLPTAVFAIGGSSRPSTAHGFRIGNESVLEKFLDGYVEKDGETFTEPVTFYPFWETAPRSVLGDTDHATHWATEGAVSRDINQCEEYATQAFADCA